MFSMTARADDTGTSVLAAGARTAMTMASGEGEGAGLVVRQLAADARRRLRGGEEDDTLRLDGEVRGTEFVVTMRDFGEPVSGPPDGVLALLDAGVVTTAEARTDGVGNVSEVRFALPAHHRVLSTESLEVLPDDSDPSPEDVTFRELRPADAPALTRALYRTYGWSYPMPSMYYPDRIAAQLESGERIGEVAVTAAGEVASHWGAVYLSPTVVETGGTITDPRFRRRGLAKFLGDRLLARLTELEVGGRLREPVLTHPATQQIALQEGATIVGAYINMTHPIQQVGITDGIQAGRGSLSVAYSALSPLSPATMWIPGPYEPMARQVLAASDWPRELAGARRDPGCPEHGSLSTSFNSDNRFGIVDIEVVGLDLVDEITTALHRMRRSGAEYVQVRLPANQPALATMGAGLVELGLGYAALIPGFRPSDDGTGDVLVEAVVRQVGEAGSRGGMRQRRAARRAQLFAALGD